MSDITRESLGLNLLIMRFLGLYPPESHKKLYRVLTYVLYFLFVVPIPILECLYLILQERLSFRQFADSTYLLPELACLIPKYWTFLNNGERIKNCIHYFGAEEFQITKKKQQNIKENCLKVCRGATVIFLLAVSSGFVTWASRPIVWKGHIFPTDIWLPFDPETAPKIYNTLAYTYIVLAVGYAAYANAVVDPLSANLCYLATAQLKVLKNNLQNLDEFVEDENPQISLVEKNRLRYTKMRDCIIHYNRILEFVKEFEICFSQVAFSQFAGGVVVFCVTCLQFTIIDVLSFDFLAMVMFFVSMFCESYIYCHFGTVLFEESNSLNEAIYLSTWYNYDVKTKKLLTVLMERAKRPMIVRCGKIFDMSLVTFTMIARRSYSLLAVLENYNIDLS